MKFLLSYSTDTGRCKPTNQDSLLIREARTEKGNLVLALICDGMGGLEKGELASKSIVDAFSEWFEHDLPQYLMKEDLKEDLRRDWGRIVQVQNHTLSSFGRRNNLRLGSTWTCLLILENGTYMIGHVGDTRVYRIRQDGCRLLTEDQTVVAREVKRGNLTWAQAEKDPRRNVLLQCIGASKTVEPAFISGQSQPGEVFLLCSDGFRHQVGADDFAEAFAPDQCRDEKTMTEKLRELIELNMQREETDNITALLIKTL